MIAPAYATTKQWAETYRLKGFNPLPSEMAGRKKPMCTYAQYWDEPAPAELFDEFPTTNLQLVCGRRWRLLVIDLDGEAARVEWECKGQTPKTWITHSGGNGRHLWFRLPEGLAMPLPYAVLWKGDGPHSAIERLCDRRLIMVPPSYHPQTGERYRFLSQAESPFRMPLPAMCPAWILGLKAIEPERPPAEPLRLRHPMPQAEERPRYRIDDVLAAIVDKPGLAASWGLRLASRANRVENWIDCHAIDRTDTHPSARISIETGWYWEAGQKAISLFELGVRLGAYGSWAAAMNDLGDRFHARRTA